MSARRDWTEDEVRVLAAIYFKADFSVGDDARDECKSIAACFNRSAAAIDRQWRNMDAVTKAKPGTHIGKIVRDTVASYSTNPAGYDQLAIRICETNGWPLVDLIRDGYQSAANRPIIAKINEEIDGLLKRFATEIEFKIFPAGAQGFQKEGVIEYQGMRLFVQMSAVAIGTKGNYAAHVRAKSSEIAESIQTILYRVEPKSFGTGRSGYYLEGRASVREEKYQINVRAVEIGETRK